MKKVTTSRMTASQQPDTVLTSLLLHHITEPLGYRDTGFLFCVSRCVYIEYVNVDGLSAAPGVSVSVSVYAYKPKTAV